MGVIILSYVLILCAKVIEVTLATVRIVLITKGEKFKGAFIGFFESLIWVFLVSTILKEITSDPIKIVVYALGFAIGNYVGTLFEQWLGFGTIRVETIVKQHHGYVLSDRLRTAGFAVTVLEGKGMHTERQVLIIHVKRRRLNDLMRLIHTLEEDVVITINEIKPVYGGHGLKK